MIDKERLDKLLNAYMDGELGPREHTEIKRLLLNDNYVLARLNELEKYQKLMNCLPKEEAPSFVMENISENIKNTTPPPPIEYQTHETEAGVKQLFVRKVIAAAAMLILTAMLGAVIYTIVSPDHIANQPMIVKTSEPAPIQFQNKPALAVNSETVAKQYSFAATLEFNTKNKRAVTAFIQRAIADNEQIITMPQPDTQKEDTYTITGSKEGLSVLLADLASSWNQLGEAWLYVENQERKPKILVSSITPQQIDKIASGENTETIVAMAEDFAVLNRMPANIRKDELVITNDEIELMPAPKPVLTSAPKTDKKTPDSITKEFQLTIVITGTE